MKKLLTLMGIILIASNTMAQPVDPDPDGIGIYFDTGATQHCEDYFSGLLSLYLCATNITDPVGLYGFQCQLVPFLSNPGGAFILDYLLMAPGINVDYAPYFSVGFTVPLPPDPSIPLVEIQLLVLTPDLIEWEVDGYLGAANPIYAAGSDPNIVISMVESVFDGPECVVNGFGNCPVSNESATWGGLKAMYK